MIYSLILLFGIGMLFIMKVIYIYFYYYINGLYFYFLLL